ncbi:MAG: hypothetical protein WBE41_25515 [Terracidiphilus sp.]
MARFKLPFLLSAILVLSTAVSLSASTDDWRIYRTVNFEINGSPAGTTITFLELYQNGRFELMRRFDVSEGYWVYSDTSSTLSLIYDSGNNEDEPGVGTVRGDDSVGEVDFSWGTDSEQKTLKMCVVSGIDLPQPEGRCE